MAVWFKRIFSDKIKTSCRELARGQNAIGRKFTVTYYSYGLLHFSVLASLSGLT